MCTALFLLFSCMCRKQEVILCSTVFSPCSTESSGVQRVGTVGGASYGPGMRGRSQSAVGWGLDHQALQDNRQIKKNGKDICKTYIGLGHLVWYFVGMHLWWRGDVSLPCSCRGQQWDPPIHNNPPTEKTPFDRMATALLRCNWQNFLSWR